MNKKVLTLCAGFLLAGGLTVPTFAESFAEVAKDAANLENQYYKVRVNTTSPATDGTGFLDVDDSKGYSTDNDESTLWTVKQISGTNGTIAGYQLISVKTGKPLSIKDGDTTYDTFAAGADKTLWFVISSKGYDGTATGSTKPWWYTLEKVAPVTYTENQLENILDGKFGIKIGYQEDTDKDGTIEDNEWYEYASYEGGNAFEGDLYVGDGDVTNGFAIYKDAKLTQRVVLTKSKWEKVSSELSEGYRFDVLSKKEYDAEVAKGTDSNILAEKFLFSVPSTVKGDPIEVVAVESNGTKHEVVVSVIEKADGTNVNRLTVGDAETFTYADYYLNNGNGGNTYVKFGASNAVNTQDFIGKLWNVYKNGRILSPDYGLTGDKEWLLASEINAKGTEGLWMWDEDAYCFRNRESGKTFTPSGWRYTDTDYTYTSGADEYTIVAQGTPAPDGTTDGYLASLTDDQLKQKAFWIGIPRVANNETDTVYLTKEANGVLSFSTDKADAVEFRFTREAFVDGDNNSMEAQLRGDYSAWKANSTTEWEPKTDIVKLYQYNVEEASTKDVLYYDQQNNQYMLIDEDDVKNYKAEKYVFKEKGENLYNILLNVTAKYNGTGKYFEVEDKAFGYIDATTGKAVNEKAAKLYSAHNTARLVKSDAAYNNVENDLFVIVDADAQQYRGDFSNTGVLDTIKIFRNDDNSYVLYEKGALLTAEDGKTAIEGFLGMENINDPKYADMHAAMLADTAFYSNTFRPQYMLAVDAEIVNDGWTCPLNPEHNTQAWREENGGHCADAVKDRPYIQGRYLVNLVDSAKAAKEAEIKLADNKFIHEYYKESNGTITPYYRLGFVQAKHIGDSLIIASTNDTIDLKNNPIDKVCTFAFRYVDAERDAFTIETLYDYTTADDDEKEIKDRTRGYIKYQNGIPVVTPKASEAWVFDLNETSETPTANETIESAADATISVVATDGAVIVKGAEGKNVIVSTILGKVVANEVLNSDNETIAAPAGIVVVSVDGESFKVAVK